MWVGGWGLGVGGWGLWVVGCRVGGCGCRVVGCLVAGSWLSSCWSAGIHSIGALSFPKEYLPYYPAKPADYPLPTTVLPRMAKPADYLLPTTVLPRMAKPVDYPLPTTVLPRTPKAADYRTTPDGEAS